MNTKDKQIQMVSIVVLIHKEIHFRVHSKYRKDMQVDRKLEIK